MGEEGDEAERDAAGDDAPLGKLVRTIGRRLLATDVRALQERRKDPDES